MLPLTYLPTYRPKRNVMELTREEAVNLTKYIWAKMVKQLEIHPEYQEKHIHYIKQAILDELTMQYTPYNGFYTSECSTNFLEEVYPYSHDTFKFDSNCPLCEFADDNCERCPMYGKWGITDKAEECTDSNSPYATLEDLDKSPILVVKLVEKIIRERC